MDESICKDSKMIYKLFTSFKTYPTKDKIVEILPILKKNLLNVNSILVYDYSLMHVNQTVETMKLLLSHGGDVNVSNDYGITPIFLQEKYDTIKFLVENGANPTIQDNYQFTPLFWQKDPDAMEYLLMKGLNINHFNKTFNISQGTIINNIYVEMFIIGGYDPYSEKNFSISPLFLQRKYETQKIMLKYTFLYYHTDSFLETP